MYRNSVSIAVVAAALAMTPLDAGAGMFDSIASVVPGSSGASGATFSSTGSLMSSQVLVGLNSTINAVQLMYQAVGKKKEAGTLQSVQEALTRDPSSSAHAIEIVSKTIDENPIDRGQLANVKDAKSKQLLVQSAGNVAVAALFNAKAVDTARQLTSMKPGVSDAMSAPSLLNTAKVVVTAVPAQLEHITNYGGMLASYMKDNKLTPPSEADKRKYAEASGVSKSDVAKLSF